jgi:hypothetical protein
MYLIERRLTGNTLDALAQHAFRAADVPHRRVAVRRRIAEGWLTSPAAEFAGQSRVAKKDRLLASTSAQGL